MSEMNSTVPQGHPEPVRAGSRRAMRAAERAAERQAALTGTQPVLTRRELRRLREEAAALQAAIEAGEITLEQAKALQDPLADAPNIDVPALSASGSHAAGGPRGGRAGDRAAAQTGVDADEPATSVAEPAAGRSTHRAATAGAGPESERASDGGTVRRAGQAAASAVVAHAPVDAAEQARREELAQERTGLLEPVDIPDAFEPGHQERGAQVESRPASLPQRRSLRARLSSETNTQAAGVAGAHRTSLTGNAQAVEAGATAGASGQGTGAGGVGQTVVPAGDGGGPAQRAGSVTRRPIVRIPAAAQGVRTVDAHTGELSAIRPADESLQSIETPQWRALRAESVVSQQADQAPADAGAGSPVTSEAGTAQPGTWTGPAMSASTPETSESDRDAVDATQESTQQAGRGLSHYLLWALFILVIILVVATLVWFYLGRESTNSALGAASAWLAQTTNGDLL